MTIAAPSDLRPQEKLLHGLSDRSRLQILTALRGGECCVGELVERSELSQPNVSKHLACLWSCGLVARERRGREVFYRPVDGVDELFEAIDTVLAQAGEGSVPAC